MPTQIRPLDPALAYTFCTICRANGNPSSPLQRDGHILKCGFGHQPSGQQLQQEGADMVKAVDMFLEQPSPTDVKWGIFINPQVRAKLEEKFRGRLLITIGTLLAALADGSLVMITGEQARDLKKLGINNGAEMLSMAKSMEQTEKERTQLLEQVSRFQDLLKQVGVT